MREDKLGLYGFIVRSRREEVGTQGKEKVVVIGEIIKRNFQTCFAPWIGHCFRRTI